MREETIVKIIIIVVVIGGIFGISKAFKALDKNQAEWEENRNAIYEECKTKTSDVEWCVKTIKPIF